MSNHFVRYTVTEKIGTLTLDSQHNRNALSRTQVAELRQGLVDGVADPEVRTVMLTHTGGTF